MDHKNIANQYDNFFLLHNNLSLVDVLQRYDNAHYCYKVKENPYHFHSDLNLNLYHYGPLTCQDEFHFNHDDLDHFPFNKNHHYQIVDDFFHNPIEAIFDFEDFLVHYDSYCFLSLIV